MKILIVIILCVLALISWRLWNKFTWKSVMVGADRNSEEQVREKYEYYRVNRIRCKIVTEIKTTITPNYPMVDGGGAPGTGITKLLVHRKDIEKANKLR